MKDLLRPRAAGEREKSPSLLGSVLSKRKIDESQIGFLIRAKSEANRKDLLRINRRLKRLGVVNPETTYGIVPTGSRGFYIINVGTRSLRKKYRIFEDTDVVVETINVSGKRIGALWRASSYKGDYEYCKRHIISARELGLVPILMSLHHTPSSAFYKALCEVYGIKPKIVWMDSHSDIGDIDTNEHRQMVVWYGADDALGRGISEGDIMQKDVMWVGVANYDYAKKVFKDYITNMADWEIPFEIPIAKDEFLAWLRRGPQTVR